jgi:hypothetical protein
VCGMPDHSRSATLVPHEPCMTQSVRDEQDCPRRFANRLSYKAGFAMRWRPRRSEPLRNSVLYPPGMPTRQAGSAPTEG